MQVGTVLDLDPDEQSTAGVPAAGAKQYLEVDVAALVGRELGLYVDAACGELAAVSGECLPALALRLGQPPATRVALAEVQKASRERRREPVDVLQRRGRDLGQAILARMEMRPWAVSRDPSEHGARHLPEPAPDR